MGTGKAVQFYSVRGAVTSVSRHVLAMALHALRASKLIDQGICTRIPPQMRCRLAREKGDLVPRVRKLMS